MTQLSTTTRSIAAGPVLELAGELDFHTAPQVKALLPDIGLEPGQQLTVDLAALTFCDSSGITVLIAARNYALAAHATIALVAVPDMVSRMFAIVGLDKVFPVHPTAHAAESAWQSSAG
ncbi:STAS domain-containing protein [Streptomyces sp. TLI_171]|uniref:STAS domain-containing protein n=1 Tax=Streptomyces sp. TLI_171 TaxID=1938859 RepID=UPI000C1A5891|nr:STAS domain-containing protein [Streptomyces sp. TLI_171]RKE05128.1 anti-sigma B factor antagonist [Streptomyces sp. TLI_171]